MAGYLPLIRSRWKAATTADSQRISRNRDECILSCSNDSGVARSLQVGEHFHRRRVSRCGSEAPYRPSAVECAVLGVSVVGEGRRTRSTGISQVRASAARTGNGRRRNRRPLGREYAVAVRCAALTSATHADAGPHEPVSHFVFRALHALKEHPSVASRMPIRRPTGQSRQRTSSRLSQKNDTKLGQASYLAAPDINQGSLQFLVLVRLAIYAKWSSSSSSSGRFGSNVSSPTHQAG